jgi:hypothetical protein
MAAGLVENTSRDTFQQRLNEVQGQLSDVDIDDGSISFDE